MNIETKIMITGSGGMLGRITAEIAGRNGKYSVCSFTSEELNIYDRLAVDEALKANAPDWIINCAAYTKIDESETHREEALRANIHGPQILGEMAAINNTKVVHISTCFVFDGNADKPYTEDDLTAPETIYGKTKRLGELALWKVLPKAVIIRTGWLYGPYGGNFVNDMLKAASKAQKVTAVNDHTGSPAYSADLANCILNLIDNSAAGLYNFCNSGACTRYEFARAVFEEARERGVNVTTEPEPISGKLYHTPAKRPAYAVLDTAKYGAVPNAVVTPWRESLKRYFDDYLEIKQGLIYTDLY